MRLQRRFLEKAGHTVTVVAPRMHGPRARTAEPDAAYLDLPSIPITPDREYAFTWPGGSDGPVPRRRDAEPSAGGSRPCPGRLLGCLHRAPLRDASRTAGRAHHAQQGGCRHPGDRAVPRARASCAQRVAAPRAAHHRRVEARGPGRLVVPAAVRASIGCRHRALVALRAPARAARGGAGGARHPSASGRTPADPHVDVVWNGIDDDILDAALATATAARAPGPPRFVWLGRMSPEKRLLPFLEALAESGDRRRCRGDRRRRSAARGAADRQEARADGVRATSPAGFRTPKCSAGSRPRTRSCRPRSASRRRA